jgi:hypothetical protein
MRTGRGQKPEAIAQNAERWTGQGRVRCVAIASLLVAVAVARQGTITLQPARDVRQFDGWILSLMDSAVCETCVTTDSRGVEHRVWVDSGRVMYQNTIVSSRVPGQEWSRPIRLSMAGDCSSPLVFERRGAAGEPWLVSMWREEHDGRFDVMCRYQFRDAWPPNWGPTWCVTICR